MSAALRAIGTSKHSNSVLMTCDYPVTVMGINKETFSTDAFIAFEERTLGKQKEKKSVDFNKLLDASFWISILYCSGTLL